MKGMIGEMRELLSYLWARQFFENAGDVERGAPQLSGSEMKSQGIPWPRFDGREMADLIGYLNSRGGSK